MPNNLTTHEAAQYLASRGFTVAYRRGGNSQGAPKPDTIKRWCIQGKFPNARNIGGRVWLIPKSDLDRLIDAHAGEREGRDE